MVAGLDRHEDGHAEAELVLVDERYPALNHAVGFEPLDALPARRRGQPHPAADLGHRERGIVLQQGEDLAVYGVHGGGRSRTISSEIVVLRRNFFCVGAFSHLLGEMYFLVSDYRWA